MHKHTRNAYFVNQHIKTICIKYFHEKEVKK